MKQKKPAPGELRQIFIWWFAMLLGFAILALGMCAGEQIGLDKCRVHTINS